MLKSIRYSITFPSTGKVLFEDVSFEKGLGSVIGANESGKSLLVEMLRFMLYGTAALRGKVEDYKTLKASLVIAVKGKEYSIERSISNAKITSDKEVLAVGVKPTNAKIIEILGFDLAVFDIACVANQGDVQKLMTMRPNERKQMVDQVIGLNRLDEITLWAADEARLIGREVSALTQGLVEPQEPIDPGPGISSRLQELRELKTEMDQLRGSLSVTMREPVEPKNEYAGIELAEAKAGQQRQREARDAAARLKSMKPPSDFTDAELEAIWVQYQQYEKSVAKRRFLAAHPRPKFTPEVLADYLNATEIHIERSKLQTWLEQARKSGQTVCPCGKTFDLEHSKIAEFEARLAALPEHRTDVPNVLDLNQDRFRNEDWLTPETLAEWEIVKDYPDDADAPKLTLHQIREHQTSNAKAGDYLILKNVVFEASKDNRDWDRIVTSIQNYERDSQLYANAMIEHNHWLEARRKQEARFKYLSDDLEVATLLETAQADADRLRHYQSMKTHYDLSIEQYRKTKAVITAKEAEAEGYKVCKNALVDLRTKVKAYLVPSLNKVASRYLSVMTDGVRNAIEISPDFEDILVDGQAIETLSGSGKACANLAIRLGLGRVLTNGVLSLFIGDEIDESMDNNRSSHLAGLLKSMADTVLQILLVTHKSPDTDYVIRIGVNGNDINY